MINWIDKNRALPQNGEEVLAYTETDSFYVVSYYNGFNRRERYDDATNDENDMTEHVRYWAHIERPVATG